MLESAVSPIPLKDPCELPDRIARVEIRENQDRMVPLSLSEPNILVRPNYFAAGIAGALPECYARSEVKNRLLRANALLPLGMRLAILDVWRSRETQAALFDACANVLEKLYPDEDETGIRKKTLEFVARPSVERTCPSPHVTGGAIDLTIVDARGESLFFGAPFDHPGPVSNTRYFEERLDAGKTLTKEETEALENRRLLYSVMTRAGFANYPGEWWHFEYGTQRWADATGAECAVYGPRLVTLKAFSVLLPSKDADITTLVSAAG